ncbi:MAG: Phosphoribosylglycinamide formyltransferase [Alphaproteobacteria bacterium MarineAlpha8_Bin1]|nr:MAG: Phosphoribosylglycinamide formyltransferase [Alphaproteobacteria bacterium MarineAlpha8_Bin1]
MGFNLGILISGNGSNMKNIIDACKNGMLKSNVSIVISDNPLAKGLSLANKENIKSVLIDRDKFSSTEKYENNILKKLDRAQVNLICLAGFMRILSKNFLKKFNHKIINIHPSLLPAFKGLNTHQRVLESGAKYSGCTIHYVNDKIDDGEIIKQKSVKILNSDDENSLKKKILMEEHKLYIRVIRDLEKNFNG